ncbi:MAG: GNAT family N-acetyltransferase [Candidatus Lokiarchaeota archaeon]|nr:GNAT family N-acetyltransferase [Candidatus Harpocratesius repetitus]
MEKLRIIQITKENEDLFYHYVNGREDEFFFYILDFKQYPEKTQLFVAIDQQKIIHGIYIIWRNQTIQIRGSLEGAMIFLKFLDKQSISIKEITGTLNHKALLEEKYTHYENKFHMYRMTLEKGEEELFEQYSYEILPAGSEEIIAGFLRKVDPKFWGTYQATDIIMDNAHLYLAIRKNEQIISLAGLWIDEKIGIISVVGTDPQFRNQGYATSIVSSGVKYLLEKTKKILIHVRVKNTPAVKIYKKVGYRPKYEYLVMKLK